MEDMPPQWVWMGAPLSLQGQPGVAGGAGKNLSYFPSKNKQLNYFASLFPEQGRGGKAHSMQNLPSCLLRKALEKNMQS